MQNSDTQFTGFVVDEGRTIPLNSLLLRCMIEYADWYERRFGTIQPAW
jgi:hypothetical protein